MTDEERPPDISSDPRMPKPGELLMGRYDVLRLIGTGGFAAVYEAVDTVASGHVAVKVLSPSKSSEEMFADRFRQEVTLVRQLQHPNTIKITDTGITETGCLFMVMEYLSGGTLESFIRRTGPLEPARVVRIAEQILKSLGEAHERGIVHRDLKPANVMIGRIGGENDYVKVLDFGIAKALEPDLSKVQTQTGLVFCTPKYAAPEILMGKGVTPAADIYSVGLMAAEMLTGKAAVSAPSEAEAIASQLSSEPVPLPAHVAGTKLGMVISKATAKKRDERYASALEMLQDLREATRGPLSTGPLLIGAEWAPTSLIKAVTASVSAPTISQTAPTQMRPSAAPTKQRGAAPTLTRPLEAQSKGGFWTVGGPLLGVAVAAGIIYMLVVLARSGDDVDDGLASVDAGSNEVVNTEEDSGGELAVVVPEYDDPVVTPEVEPDRGPSAREILAARLAASEWQTGSWLPADELTEGTNPQGSQLGLPPTEGSGDMAMAHVPVEGSGHELAMVDSQTPEGSGQGVVASHMPEGSGDGQAVAIALIDDPVQRAIAEKAEAERLSLLYESAEVNQEAVNMLQTALAEGDINPEQQLDASKELVDLTANVVNIMLELDRCDAAERRLDSVVDRAGFPMDVAGNRVAEMRASIQVCRERVWAERQRWNPREYMTLVSDGQRYYDEAMALEPTDLTRRGLLYQSVHSRQEAIDRLEAALAEERIPESNRADAGRDLVHLNDLVVATLFELDNQLLVDEQIQETLEDPSLLPEEGVAQLFALQNAIETDRQVAAEEEAAEIAALADPLEVSTVEGSGGEGVVELGSGDGTGDAALAMLPAQGFDFARYTALVQEGAQLYQEALATTTPTTPVESVVEEVLPTVYSVSVRINSEPRGARVYQGEVELGRTPFTATLESTEAQIVLTVRKSNYEASRVTVDMTAGGEFSRNVELRASHPFGHTGTLGGN